MGKAAGVEGRGLNELIGTVDGGNEAALTYVLRNGPKSVEGSKAASGYAVYSSSKSDDVCPPNPAGIVLDLLVALEGLLRRQIVRSRSQTGVVETDFGERKGIDGSTVANWWLR